MADNTSTRTTRLSGDLDDRFTKYRGDNDMTNSEALRVLVRSGLAEANTDPLDDRPDGLLAGLLWDARRDIHNFVLITVLSLGFSMLTTGVISLGFLTLAGSYALTVLVGAIDALVLDRRVTLWLTEQSTADAGVGVEA